MKRNQQFILREIAGKVVLVPFGQKALDMNGIVTLNETAKFLWEKCEEDCVAADLEAALMEEYKIDKETAANAVEIFVTKMKEAGCLDE